MKKRYNKLVAYLLMDFSTVGVGAVLLALIEFVIGIVERETESIIAGVLIFLLGIFCLFLTFLLTLYINYRTPKGERIGTWLRAWWLGFKIAFKISMCCTLIFIPAMLNWSIKISQSDLEDLEESNHWYDSRGKVYDDKRNEYKVGSSGEYVEDKKGEWQKVNRDNDGNPYIVDANNNKIWLK